MTKHLKIFILSVLCLVHTACNSESPVFIHKPELDSSSQIAVNEEPKVVPSQTPKPQPKPKPEPEISPIFIILIIADGMQLENEIALSRYLYGEDRGLSFHSWQFSAYVTTWDVTTYNRYAYHRGFPKWVSMESFIPALGYDVYLGGWAPYPVFDSGDETYFLTPLDEWGGGNAKVPATDSASAATAMATGVKTDDGNISWLPGDPYNGKLVTIAEQARAKGLSIGIITTVPFSHATPAAFVSHNKSRSEYFQIAYEIFSVTQPEVVIGGGHPEWNSEYFDLTGLNFLRNNKDYILVERKAGENGGAEVINGAKLAIEQNKKLFGLFGGINGNFESPIPHDGEVGFDIEEENPQLSEAAWAALMVLSRDPEGFFLMIEQGDLDWANHNNDFARSIGCAWDLEQAVKAVEYYIDQPGDMLDWTNTMLIVTADHATGYLRLKKILPKGDLPAQEKSGGPWTYPDDELSWGTSYHTNEPVCIYAKGAGLNFLEQFKGLWYPGTILIDNTQIHEAMAQYLEHGTNPD